MKTIGITGASGFIGRHVAAAFRDAGSAVRAFSRAARPGLIALDYLDADSLARALDGVEAVVHIAGLAHVSPKSLDDPLSRYRESNVGLSVAMMKASIRAGVRRFVLLSSAGVLGRASPAGGFDDASPAMPYDPYTMSKLESEQQLLEAAEGNISLAMLRPPMVYGPGAPGSYRRLCRWIDRGLPLPLTRLTSRRSILGVRNLCDLLVTIVESAREVPRELSTLLVADPEPVAVAEFAKQIAQVRGRRALLLPVPPKLLEWGLRAAHLQEEYRRLALPFELTPSRALSLFSWRPPHTTLEELAWARNQ